MTSTSQSTRTQRRQEKRADPTRVGFWRVIAWSSSHASQAANVLVVGYFVLYCTDTLGLNPAIVGALFLASKVVDAVGTLLSGWLVDISPETRWGKARPYDLAIIGVWVFTAIMFSTPASLNDTGKYVWVFASFTMVSAIFTPLFLANQPLFMARAFGNREAITKVSSTSGLVVALAGVLTGITFPIFVQQVGKSPEGWTTLVLLYSIPMLLFGLVRFLTVREGHSTEEGLPRVRFSDIRTVLSSNPYLWGVGLIQLIAAVVTSLGALSYYYRYIVGNIALQGLLGALALVLLPLFVVMPKLIRRFSVSKLIAVAGLLGVIGFTMYSFAGANIVLLIIAAVFTGASNLPVSFLLPILVIDNATYNEWKGNRRLESVGGAVQAFALAVGGGLAGGATGILLGAFGYDGTKAVQSAAATTGIVVVNSWLPAALSVIIIVVALFYDRFERQLPVITREIDIQRIARGATPMQAPGGTNFSVQSGAAAVAEEPTDPRQ